MSKIRKIEGHLNYWKAELINSRLVGDVYGKAKNNGAIEALESALKILSGLRSAFALLIPGIRRAYGNIL